MTGDSVETISIKRCPPTTTASKTAITPSTARTTSTVRERCSSSSSITWETTSARISSLTFLISLRASFIVEDTLVFILAKFLVTLCSTLELRFPIVLSSFSVSGGVICVDTFLDNPLTSAFLVCSSSLRPLTFCWSSRVVIVAICFCIRLDRKSVV